MCEAQNESTMKIPVVQLLISARLTFFMSDLFLETTHFAWPSLNIICRFALEPVTSQTNVLLRCTDCIEFQF